MWAGILGRPVGTSGDSNACLGKLRSGVGRVGVEIGRLSDLVMSRISDTEGVGTPICRLIGISTGSVGVTVGMLTWGVLKLGKVGTLRLGMLRLGSADTLKLDS